MEYELRCPSCGQVEHHRFVRIRAAARCPACGKQWRIAEKHIRRYSSKASKAADPSPAANDLSGLDRRAGTRPGEEIGLSGLSDVMRRGGPADRREAQASGQGAAELPEAQPITPPAASTPRDTKRHPWGTHIPSQTARPRQGKTQRILNARRRLISSGALLLGGLVIAVCFVSLSLLYALTQAPLTSKHPVGTEKASQPTQAPPDLPRITGQPLDTDPWMVPPAPEPMFDLVQGDAYLSVLGTVYANGQPALSTTLHTDRKGLFPEGLAHLYLVDQLKGVLVAQTTQPVAMVTADHPQPLRTPLPDEISNQQSYALLSWVELGPPAPNALPVEGIRVKAYGQGAQTQVRLTTNLSKHPDEQAPTPQANRGFRFSQLMVRLTAQDASGGPLRTFAYTIQAQPHLDVLASAPLPEGQTAAGWDIRAYAR